MHNGCVKTRCKLVWAQRHETSKDKTLTKDKYFWFGVCIRWAHVRG